MIHFLKEELNGIRQFLKKNGNEAIIVVAATLSITLNRYHPIQNEWLSPLLYYAVFPILVILIVMRKNPLDFGLRLGSPRIWGFYVFLICLAAAVILYVSSFNSSLQSY